jgi:hypothetical protein
VKRLWLIVAAVLLLAGCGDSKNPLSDPQTSKPDERLSGVWQWTGKDGQVTYYHVGCASEKLPKGTMRVAHVQHEKGRIESPGEFLMFPTILGEKTYLNVAAVKGQQVKLVEEKGWKAVDSYMILKYQVDGDQLSVWAMDADAKKRAIDGGKVEGVIEKNKPIKFTDTTENVARFVAEAGDSLFSKKPERLERVGVQPKDRGLRVSAWKEQTGKPATPTPPLRPLGNNLMVDKNNIIWDGDHPVGIWGIDGCKITSK